MALSVSIDGLTMSPQTGTTLFECAESLAVRVPTSCFEQGKCRECLMEIERGAEHLSEPSPEEKHLGDGFRLSCRARVMGRDGAVQAHTLRRGAMQIVEDSARVAGDLRLDPLVTRAGDRVLIDGEVAGQWGGPIHGLAIDLGTTTVALRLYDLEDGRLVASQAFENPQRFGGSDVMARIRFDTENEGRLLQRTLLGYLNHAIDDLPCEADSVFEIVVAGNTTMRDLFFGLNVYSIGQRPYRSLTEKELREGERRTTALTEPARRLRLPVASGARVYGLPLISGHVGADAAAGLLASGLAESDALAAFIDIGTNTELIVGNRHRLLAASCPAGPAFEGGGVGCGMPALDGAIERIRILAEGRLDTSVIGEQPPVGICGSGLVDLLSELLRTDRMNAQGRFEEELDSFCVAPGLALLESDVNELAQAKGANAAGLRIALNRYGVEPGGIERLYLAGGFARHIDLDGARRIGLIPDIPDERIVRLGNAALEGAAAALLSVSRREWLEGLVRKVEHVELETDPAFFDYFTDGCQFVRFGREVG